MVVYNQGAAINKTSGSDITFYDSSTTAVVKIPVLPNKTYFLSSNNIQFYIGETQSNGTTQTGNPDNNLDWSTNTIITTTDNTYFIVAVVRYIGDEIVITKDVFQNSNMQLEYGTKQTSYQPYNGAIVHKKEIADVEHIETIYDMSSSNSNINWGNTAGILLFNELTITHDFSGFKKYDFIYEVNTRSDNWYCSARTVTIHDAIAGDWKFTYFDCVSPSNCYAQDLSGIEIYTAFRMAYNKQSVTVMSSQINANGSFSIIDSGYSFYRLIKIVGYK